MPDFLPLSVVIITLNEARNIRACLDSVRALTDDIVVVDSGSTDGTQEICRARGARVFARDWSGFSAQKNFGNDQARHDWILSLDADEQISPELARSIREEFMRCPRAAAYDLSFRNHFAEKRIRFGAWHPEFHVRLFDRRVLQWNTDDVHEGLVALAKHDVVRLRGDVLHFTVASRAQLAVKSERYGALFAAKLRRRNRRVAWWKIWLNPALRFTRDYVFRLGVLDGAAGFFIAWEAARYTHLKYLWAAPAVQPSPVARWAFAAPVAILASIWLYAPRAPHERSMRVARSTGEIHVHAAAFSSDAHDDDDSIPNLPLVDDDDVST